jgi:hypothetical protein
MMEGIFVLAAFLETFKKLNHDNNNSN